MLNFTFALQVSVTLDDKNENDITQGMNKLGFGVAMNNTMPAAATTPANIPNPHTNVNNIQMDDVQKLQQQLQDIKEQVCTSLYSPAYSDILLNSKLICTFFPHLHICHRPHVRCVLIVWKIWCSSAGMARAKCAVIKSKAVQFVERRWKNVFYYFEYSLYHINTHTHTYASYKQTRTYARTTGMINMPQVQSMRIYSY